MSVRRGEADESQITGRRRWPLAVAVGILGAILLLPLLWLRGGVFQEPIGTAATTAITELTGGWRAVGDADDVVLKSSELDRFLRSQEADGWTYVEQMGSGYVFARDDETEVIVCRLYSTRYRICPLLDRS